MPNDSWLTFQEAEMIIAIGLAAVVSGAAALPKPIELRGADMVCVGDGAHLTFWEGKTNAPTRLLTADAKAGETVVVDTKAWTAVAKPLLQLKTAQFGFQVAGAQPDAAHPERSVLDCSSSSPAPLKLRVVNFASR